MKSRNWNSNKGKPQPTGLLYYSLVPRPDDVWACTSNPLLLSNSPSNHKRAKAKFVLDDERISTSFLLRILEALK